MTHSRRGTGASWLAMVARTWGNWAECALTPKRHRRSLAGAAAGVLLAHALPAFAIMPIPPQTVTTTVKVGINPAGVAVNPATGKIYVASFGSASVSVIDPASNTASLVTVGTQPINVAVNPITNKIYVANAGSNNVTVIDGTNNSTTPVAAGNTPRALAVNPVTNKISVAYFVDGTVTGTASH